MHISVCVCARARVCVGEGGKICIGHYPMQPRRSIFEEIGSVLSTHASATPPRIVSIVQVHTKPSHEHVPKSVCGPVILCSPRGAAPRQKVDLEKERLTHVAHALRRNRATQVGDADTVKPSIGHWTSAQATGSEFTPARRRRLPPPAFWRGAKRLPLFCGGGWQ